MPNGLPHEVVCAGEMSIHVTLPYSLVVVVVVEVVVVVLILLLLVLVFVLALALLSSPGCLTTSESINTLNHFLQ